MAKETYNLYGFWPKDVGQTTWTEYPVATGQTLAAGDPVIISGGQIAVAVQNSSAALVGVIAQDSVSQTAGTMVKVWDDPDTVFIGRASANTAETIGALYDLSGTTGVFEVNMAASTQDIFQVLGTVPGDTAATDCRYLEVRIYHHTLRGTT